jgi:hypothetical protein
MDTYDRLVSKLYDEFRVNLVKVPRAGILPGEVLLWGGGEDPAVGPVAFASLLLDGAEMPAPGKPQPSGKIEATVSSYRKVKVQANFFGGLLSGFLPGVKGKVAASAKDEVNGEFCFNFKQVTQRSIDVAALQKALHGKILDPAGVAAINMDHGGQLLMIVDTFAANGVRLRWRDGSGTDVSADIAMENVAKLAGGHAVRAGTEGSVVVDGRPDTVFGVRLMRVEQTETGLAVRLEHSRLEVLGGEREVDPKDYIMTNVSGIAFTDDASQDDG